MTSSEGARSWSPQDRTPHSPARARRVRGVTAQSVAQRNDEIGIRLMRGARRGDIVRLIAGRGMALAALGIPLFGRREAP